MTPLAQLLISSTVKKPATLPVQQGFKDCEKPPPKEIILQENKMFQTQMTHVQFKSLI